MSSRSCAVAPSQNEVSFNVTGSQNDNWKQNGKKMKLKKFV